MGRKYVRAKNADTLVLLYFARDHRARWRRTVFNQTKFCKADTAQTLKRLGVIEYMKALARASQRNTICVIRFCLEQVNEHTPSRTEYNNFNMKLQ